MLIDMITAKIDETFLSPEQVDLLRVLGDRVRRFTPKSGEIIYETQAWDSIRSDTHGVSVRMASDSFWIHGSPARVIGDGDAVFGNGAASELDLYGSLTEMIRFVSKQTGVILPKADYWKMTRIDVTDNILLDTEEQVMESLRILQGCEGGRYKVSNTSGSTVYWGGKSKRKKAKAYAKGQHLKYLMKLKQYDGKRYTENEITKAERLLRLELTIGNLHLREHCWKSITADQLRKEHQKYFLRMIGDKTMTNESELLEKLNEVCKTSGQATTAYSFFLFISKHGWQKAKNEFSKPTFYRHITNLRKAGIGDADISSGEIVALRKKVIECQSISTWSELYLAA